MPPDCRLYLEPDPFGEPVIWRDDAHGVPHPVIAKHDIAVGSRWLWDEIVTRLTSMRWADPASIDLPVEVCVAHKRFTPCRFDGPHRFSIRPEDVRAVREHQEDA